MTELSLCYNFCFYATNISSKWINSKRSDWSFREEKKCSFDFMSSCVIIFWSGAFNIPGRPDQSLTTSSLCDATWSVFRSEEVKRSAFQQHAKTWARNVKETLCLNWLQKSDNKLQRQKRCWRICGSSEALVFFCSRTCTRPRSDSSGFKDLKRHSVAKILSKGHPLICVIDDVN